MRGFRVMVGVVVAASMAACAGQTPATQSSTAPVVVMSSGAAQTLSFHGMTVTLQPTWEVKKVTGDHAVLATDKAACVEGGTCPQIDVYHGATKRNEVIAAGQYCRKPEQKGSRQFGGKQAVFYEQVCFDIEVWHLWDFPGLQLVVMSKGDPGQVEEFLGSVKW